MQASPTQFHFSEGLLAAETWKTYYSAGQGTSSETSAASRPANLPAAVMPVRAGWVPCVGIQPPKPMVQMIEEADAIAEECERAFQPVPSSDAPAASLSPESESLILDIKLLCYCHTHPGSSALRLC